LLSISSRLQLSNSVNCSVQLILLHVYLPAEIAPPHCGTCTIKTCFFKTAVPAGGRFRPLCIVLQINTCFPTAVFFLIEKCELGLLGLRNRSARHAARGQYAMTPLLGVSLPSICQVLSGSTRQALRVRGALAGSFSKSSMDHVIIHLIVNFHDKH
jgi:hypothetical protein